MFGFKKDTKYTSRNRIAPVSRSENVKSSGSGIIVIFYFPGQSNGFFVGLNFVYFGRNCKFSRKTNTKQSKDVNIDLSNRTVNRHRVRSPSWLNWTAVLDFTFEYLYTRLSSTHKTEWKRTIYSSEFNKVTRFIWI